MIRRRIHFGLLLLVTAIVVGCGPKERTFDADRAFRDLEAQVAMGPRVPGTKGHAEAFSFLRSRAESLADRVDVHEFPFVSPLDSSKATCKNVVAIFNETSSTRILFGAHWDTRPIADADTTEALRSQPVPGANDGASGAALLLELAAALHDVPPSIGVDLVWFDAEDSGTHEDPATFALGSARFVQDHPDYRPSLVVVFDMIGKRDLRILQEPISLERAGALVRSVWQIGRDLGLRSLVDSIGPPVYDDHVAFLLAGVPAIDLIDFADPHWHTTRDLPEHCAPESLEEMGRLALEIVRRSEESLSP